MVDIHLCQPDVSKSCAACCGIYNYADNTRDSLLKRFTNRTKLFARVRENLLALEDYQDIIRHRENNKRIYATIYTCEFVGFLDEDSRRVGCMLHPLANCGKDLRVISFYGRDICKGHFCPSYQKLDRNEAGVLMAALDDWYLYGSAVTDIDFVKTFFAQVQNRLGETLDVRKVRANPSLLDVVRRYCGLKVSWPFRDTTRPRFGKYYFVGEEYDIARIDYASLDASASPYDAVFVSLSSLFGNKEELDKANGIVDALIEEFCRGYH
ncbi:MAG TPA: hypothetical protein VMU10_05155 [Desulfomonilia bacterium]|nr:hypothetical protein [Desulfomonilia bacterium]